MKKWIAVAVFVLFASSLSAQQAYLGDALWHKLHAGIKENTSLRVVVVLRDQLDLQAFNQECNTRALNLQERQRLLISRLNSTASEGQMQVREFIGNYNKGHKSPESSLKSYWIVSMLVTDARPELIWQLAERSDVAWMDLDEAYMSGPVKPVEEHTSIEKSVGSAETGLRVIGADKMWKLGYTGQNRISYSIDTGVWSEHPAIRDRFMANFFPLSQCWFPYDSPVPADKSGSHGTHTLGTTLGLDPANHDTIGVAFNAYWICSDPVATSMATVKPLSDFIYAFEFALNPDGDTSTVWDIPDAINNSWGYAVQSDTGLCDSYVSQMFAVIDAAGIANVFSAGNEGPGDSTICTPQFIEASINNVFTIGALDGNNASYPIASFSSRGPSICGHSGPTLIKPEVSAPGVDVRSSVNTNSYASYSGTSMAAPHVTGAVLLLKEAFPALAGNEILNALYQTATDLGIPGEDNTYGMGLINVYAAYQYLSGFYTPATPGINGADAELLGLNGSEMICDTAYVPSVTLRNNGNQAITQGSFKYRINGGDYSTYAWSGNIAPAASASVTLPSVPFLIGGYKEMQVNFISDTALHEANIINNSRMLRLNVRPSQSLPFVEDFENGIDSVLWYQINPDHLTTWDTASTGGLMFSEHSAVMRFNNNLTYGETDDLVTPCFDLSNVDSARLKFDVAYQYRHPLMSDSLLILVSTNCGQSFPDTVYLKTGPQLQTYDTITPQFVPERPDQWRSESIDMSAYAGQGSVILKFRGINRKGNYLYLDNIKLFSGAEPVAVETQKYETFSISPNPAKDQLFIKSGSDCMHAQIRIIDIHGRLCSAQEVKFREGQITSISLQGLNNGFYILNISSEKGEQNFKFIKN
jgi:bacillopeptidase F